MHMAARSDGRSGTRALRVAVLAGAAWACSPRHDRSPAGIGTGGILPRADSPASSGRASSGSAERSITSCAPSGRVRQHPIAPSELENLAGHYVLFVTRQSDGPHAPAIRATLQLWRTDSLHRYFTLNPNFPGHVGPWPDHLLYGSTDLRPASVGVEHPGRDWTSANPDAPGVQLNADGVILFGIAAAPAAGVTADVGAAFTIGSVWPHGFRGSWSALGPVSPRRGGGFCAVRR